VSKTTIVRLVKVPGGFNIQRMQDSMWLVPIGGGKTGWSNGGSVNRITILASGHGTAKAEVERRYPEFRVVKQSH